MQSKNLTAKSRWCEFWSYQHWSRLLLLLMTSLLWKRIKRRY